MYFMNGIHKRPNPTSSTVVMRPTATSRCSLASGRSLRYTSHVSSVEQELKADASELINAASIPASTRPLKPAGRSRVTSAGYAASADPPRMSAYIAAAMIPGSTKMNTGRSEEHTSELQSPCNLVCRLLLEKKKRQRQGQ